MAEIGTDLAKNVETASAPEDDKTRTFDVVIEAKAKTAGTARNEVTIHSLFSDTYWDMPTDEGPYHGGESSAPPPLAYFVTGVVACLMTQIRAFSKRLKVPVDGVEVDARFHWQGEQTGRNPYSGKPQKIDLDIDIQSDCSAEDLIRLVEGAKEGCFAEQSIELAFPIGHRLKVGDDWVEV